MDRKIGLIIAFYGILLLALGVLFIAQVVYFLEGQPYTEKLLLLIGALLFIVAGIGLLLRKNSARIEALYLVAFIAIANTAFALGVFTNQSVPILWKLFFIGVLFINYYFFYFFTRPKVKEQFKQIEALNMINKKLIYILLLVFILIWGLNIDVISAEVDLAIIFITGAVSSLVFIIRRDKIAKILEKSNKDSRFLFISMCILFCFFVYKSIQIIVRLLY